MNNYKYLILYSVLFLLFCMLYAYILKSRYIKIVKKEKIKELVEFEKEQERLYDERVDNLKKQKEELIESLNKAYRLEEDKVDFQLKHLKEKIEQETNSYKELEVAKANKELEEQIKLKQEAYNKFEEEKKKEMQAIESELEDFKAKQRVAAEEVLRQRQLKEERDFYRVVISDESKEDIELLNSIRKKLHKVENLDKLIYDVYISLPASEMAKRVLGGGNPCGIYKITRSTGEVYIGKSVNVKDRWIQHCKTVYNVGTISRSSLHTAMAEDGLDTFTFQLLEEVERNKLGEREKYWINYYNSKEMGLNQKGGG